MQPCLASRNIYIIVIIPTTYLNCLILFQYKDDGEWKDMEAGYPKMVVRGSKTSFVFRFEKFNNTIFYDPALDLSESDDGNSPGDGDSSGEIVKVSFVLMVFALFINLIHCIF